MIQLGNWYWGLGGGADWEKALSFYYRSRYSNEFKRGIMESSGEPIGTIAFRSRLITKPQFAKALTIQEAQQRDERQK